MPQIFQLQGFCPDHYINSHLFQPVPSLWKAAPGRQPFTEPGIAAVVLVLVVSVHPDGICLEQQAHLSPAKAECASPSNCACVPEKGHQNHRAPSPACASCRISSLDHPWQDQQGGHVQSSSWWGSPLGTEGSPGHRWMSWPAEPPVHCWQSPWRGLLCVWLVRIPCAPVGTSGFDRARAPG